MRILFLVVAQCADNSCAAEDVSLLQLRGKADKVQHQEEPEVIKSDKRGHPVKYEYELTKSQPDPLKECEGKACGTECLAGIAYKDKKYGGNHYNLGKCSSSPGDTLNADGFAEPVLHCDSGPHVMCYNAPVVHHKQVEEVINGGNPVKYEYELTKSQPDPLKECEGKACGTECLAGIAYKHNKYGGNHYNLGKCASVPGDTLNADGLPEAVLQCDIAPQVQCYEPPVMKHEKAISKCTHFTFFKDRNVLGGVGGWCRAFKSCPKDGLYTPSTPGAKTYLLPVPDSPVAWLKVADGQTCAEGGRLGQVQVHDGDLTKCAEYCADFPS